MALGSFLKPYLIAEIGVNHGGDLGKAIEMIDQDNVLVVALGAALLPLPLHPWPTLVVALFGLFLLIQSASLRLEFKEEALIVWQNGRELRRFPYDQWLSWRLFAPWLPGLFYFRETQSIHFLPILFSPKELREQLELRVGELEVPATSAD